MGLARPCLPGMALSFLSAEQQGGLLPLSSLGGRWGRMEVTKPALIVIHGRPKNASLPPDTVRGLTRA